MSEILNENIEETMETLTEEVVEEGNNNEHIDQVLDMVSEAGTDGDLDWWFIAKVVGTTLAAIGGLALIRKKCKEKGISIKSLFTKIKDMRQKKTNEEPDEGDVVDSKATEVDSKDSEEKKEEAEDKSKK